MFTYLFTHKLPRLKWFIFQPFLETHAAFDKGVPLYSFRKYKSPTSKGWSYPDGNQYKNVHYDVFLDPS